MNGWFIALLVLYVIELGFALSKHGQPREGKYSFGSTLIGAGLVIWLAYMAVVTGF